ncbi:MAG TPA: ATP-binding protein, partial [Polyangiaceae bacterium]|nr:ATP-binding protein [Polyangiaceae bacterium]
MKSKHNVVILGKTGVGKSYVGAALADAACRSGYRAIFFRVPRLLEELSLARASGAYASLLGKLSRIDVLVLDDFLLNPMTGVERRDLLEVIEDRNDMTSTVITTTDADENLARGRRRSDNRRRDLRPARPQCARAQAGRPVDSQKESLGEPT